MDMEVYRHSMLHILKYWKGRPVNQELTIQLRTYSIRSQSRRS